MTYLVPFLLRKNTGKIQAINVFYWVNIVEDHTQEKCIFTSFCVFSSWLAKIISILKVLPCFNTWQASKFVTKKKRVLLWKAETERAGKYSEEMDAHWMLLKFVVKYCLFFYHLPLITKFIFPTSGTD